jgi:hypothetical protein
MDGVVTPQPTNKLSSFIGGTAVEENASPATPRISNCHVATSTSTPTCRPGNNNNNNNGIIGGNNYNENIGSGMDDDLWRLISYYWWYIY